SYQIWLQNLAPMIHDSHSMPVARLRGSRRAGPPQTTGCCTTEVERNSLGVPTCSDSN
ncbi:hypothetical protein COCMIDRAFT_103548, partial [Bipolaris oryzae ATCC 44560]